MGVCPESHIKPMVKMAMTNDKRLLSVESTLRDFVSKISMRLDEVISKSKEIPSRLNLSIENLNGVMAHDKNTPCFVRAK